MAYPLMILGAILGAVVGKTISWKIAAAAYATVASLGALAGILTRAIS